MKNKLLAASIAASIGVLGSGIASAMEFSVYGSIRGGVYQVDTDSSYAGVAEGFGEDQAFDEDGFDPDMDPVGPRGAKVKGRDALELGVNNFGSRIGISGSEDLGNGASAGFVFERGSDDEEELGRRHENVWISGNWGKLTLGETDATYRNAANWDQSVWLGGALHLQGSRANGIRYDSNFGGPFSFSLQAIADDADSAGAGGAAAVGFDDNDSDTVDEDVDLLINVTSPAEKDEDGIDLFSATASLDVGSIATINIGFLTDNVDSAVRGKGDDAEYDRHYDQRVISANGVVGAFSWYVAYEESDDTSDFTATETGNGANGAVVDCPGGAGGDDCRAARAHARNYVSEVYTTERDREVIGIFLAYALGERDSIWLEYEDASVDGADANLGSLDEDTILLGYRHKFGPGTSFIVEYAKRDKDSDFAADTSTFWAGLKVDF